MEAIIRQTNAWACYDCGKCTASCPVSRAGAPYNPRRHVLASNLGRADQAAADPALFSCLTCAQCDERCPAEVDYIGLVRELRERAFTAGSEPTCPHGGALQSMMRLMARGGTRQDRLAWLDDDLATESERGAVFLWVGCTPHLDAFFPELDLTTVNGSRAAVRLLNRLGETPVVSAEERCCGHDLLWAGDRASFEALARHNVDLVRASGAETLVVPCAECARTWRKDYASLLGEGRAPRVLHLSEFLAERLDDLSWGDRAAPRATFQDPCRLSRHLGGIEAPRTVLGAVPGLVLDEMRRHGRHGQCCAGGTWNHCDRYSKQIQVERLREARATGAEVMVTACPKCQVHFRCAMHDPNLGDEIDIELRDLAEVVVAALA